MLPLNFSGAFTGHVLFYRINDDCLETDTPALFNADAYAANRNADEKARMQCAGEKLKLLAMIRLISR